MSIQEAPNGTETVNDTSTVDTPLDKGGSPSEEVIQAGDDVEDTFLEETPESEEDQSVTETPADGKGDGPSASEAEAERIADLESRLAFSEDILNEVRQRMNADPELRAKLSNGSTAPDWRASSLKILRDKVQPAAAEALVEALSPVFDRLDRLERDYETVTKPAVGSLSQTVGSTEFVNSLADNGISPETMKSKPFVKHLQVLRQDPNFRRNEAESKSYAGRLAAKEWIATRTTLNGNRDEQSRLRTAKAGRFSSEPSRGAASAERVYKIERVPGDPQAAVDQAHKLRIAAVKKGIDPRTLKIEYINPKS